MIEGFRMNKTLLFHVRAILFRVLKRGEGYRLFRQFFMRKKTESVLLTSEIYIIEILRPQNR